MKHLLGALVGLALATATLSGLLHLLGLGSRESAWRPIGEIALLSAVWLLANGPYEGPVLWRPAYEHGLTVADLAVLPGLAIALLLVAQKAA